MNSEEENKTAFDPEREFFVIRPDSLEAVQTKLYGFCISNGEIITDARETEGSRPEPDGAYIFVVRTEHQIQIYQDFAGCYGLYLYRNEDIWALSNSFLYLVDQIRDTCPVTFNKTYADHLLCAGLSAQSYSETLVNEITCLDRAAEVTIDLDKKEISFKLTDFKENTIAPDSAEGMAVLDAWYLRWTKVIRNLKQKAGDIRADLSGGYDTRLTLGLILGSGIDLNEVYFHSCADGLHTHAEDYEIAENIAEYYGFRLNSMRHPEAESKAYSVRDILNQAFYLKLGFHNQMHWGYRKYEKYQYLFTGSGGGCLRDLSESLPAWTCEENMIKNQVRLAEEFGADIADSAEKMLKRSFDGIREKYRSFGRDPEPESMGIRFYMETRGRNHFGKWILESWFTGEVMLCPLLDSGLHRLRLNTEGCPDKNLLIAIIYDRYQPELLNFSIEGNRGIAPATIEYAHHLNRAYPCAVSAKVRERPSSSYETDRIKPAVLQSGKPDAEKDKCRTVSVRREGMQYLIREAFYASGVKGLFEMLYSPDIYYRLAQRWSETDFYPEQNAFVVLAIAKIYQDCLANETMQRLTDAASYLLHHAADTAADNFPERNLLYDPYLKHYITARIKLKNRGKKENDIQLLKVSDQKARIRTPEWMQTGDGRGYEICSAGGVLNIWFACRGEGELQLALLSEYIKDSEGKAISFPVDFIEFTLNDEEIFREPRVLDFNVPYQISRAVRDGEVLKLELKWKPHDEREKNILRKQKEQKEAEIKNLETAANDLKSEKRKLIKELRKAEDRYQKSERENEKKKEEIARIQNSGSYKIGRAITRPARKIKQIRTK